MILTAYTGRAHYFPIMPTVLVLLADGFEEIEAFAPVDLLRRAGVEVTVASLNDNRHATGRSGITAHADAALSTVLGLEFDMIFLPGGAGVKLLRTDPCVREIVLQHHAGGCWLAAICAAPTVLHDCGLLAGRRLVSIRRKDGRSQRRSLANNLPANAENCVADSHGPTMLKKVHAVKGIAQAPVGLTKS